MQPDEQRRDGTNRDAWLVSVLMRRKRPFLHYLIAAYDRLLHLPRRTRRQLQRRLAVTLVGAALLLALGRTPTNAAATMEVVDGEVAISDNGRCSLIEAIENANDTSDGIAHDDCVAGDPAGADVISLPQGGRFILEEAVEQYNLSLLGLPWIASPVTISGNGSSISNGSSYDLVSLAVAASGDLTFSQLHLDGSSDGVYNLGGKVTMRDSTIAFAYEEYFVGGTGFLNGGEATIEGSAIFANDGTGVWNTGKLTLQDSSVSGNWLGVYNSGEIEISGSTINGNYDGGGVYNWNGLMTITESVISGNFGGGLFNRVYTFPYDPSETASVTISYSVISDNEANSGGGGIYNSHGDVTIIATTINSNSARRGGGISNVRGRVSLTASTVNGNTADSGGGIINQQSATLTVVNSTFSGNTAAVGGGALYNLYSQATFDSSTITTNSAGQKGGGILNDASTLYGWNLLRLEQTIVAGNNAPDGRELFNEGGVPFSTFENLFGANGDAGLVGAEPGFADIVPAVPLDAILHTTLSDLGGPTLTHGLLFGSPAVDAISSFGCDDDEPEDNVDQRGLPRNADGDGQPGGDDECDIGAFERQGTLPFTVFLSAVAGAE